MNAVADYIPISYTLDRGCSERAAIGLIVLATDQTIEYEWRHLMDLPGVNVFEARIFNDPTITAATLAAMEPAIAPAAKLIQPGRPPEVVAFGCTSGAMVIGEDRIFKLIQEAHPTAACTTPITAGIAAMKTLRLGRIGLLTPYVRAINDWMREYIEAKGVRVAAMASYEEPVDAAVAHIDAQSVEAGVKRLASVADVDGVFVSCTSLRVAHRVAQLERLVGKPVTSSNHAMAWHSLRLAGVKDTLPHHGSLFSH